MVLFRLMAKRNLKRIEGDLSMGLARQC